MISKLKTFWLNLGFLDRDMDLSERRQILRALSEQRVEVRAIFNYFHTPQRIFGLDKIWLLRFRAKGLIGRIWLFIEQQMVLIKNLDVHVIVVRAFNLHQTLPVWFFQRKILRRRLPKFVLDIRTLPVDIANDWRGKQQRLRFYSSIRLAFRYFDGISIITEKMKGDLQRIVNNYDKKVCVWSSGVDPILFDPEHTNDIKHIIEFDRRFVIMYHGILSPNRGLQQSIEAIAMLKKKYPEIMLFFLGKGPGQAELEKLIKRFKLENHVFIHQPVSFEDVPKYIKAASVGILPFPNLNWWNTSSPIKLFEYLAMKKPVILTDIAAHRAVLGNRQCGFFVPDHRPASIACGISTVLEKTTELAELGNIARKIVIEHFTWERQARKIKKYFQDLLEDG